jgi:hypothetical protein
VEAEVDKQIGSHPAAELFPMFGSAELAELAQDIKEHGLLDPIVTYQEMVLDGRNRYKACGIAGVEPRFVGWDGSGGSPLLFVISKNLHRRHLTPAQHATIGLKLTPLLREEARERQATGGPGIRGGNPLAPIGANGDGGP